MKRGLVAALALTLALAGCGGSGGDSGDGPGGGPGAAGTPSAAPSAGGTGTQKKPDAPTPPAQSKAAKAFGDCMRKQGVELPTPSPNANPSPRQSSSVSQQEIKKRMTAVHTCMKKMAKSPGLR